MEPFGKAADWLIGPFGGHFRPNSQIGIGAWRSSTSPATPPGMRVRTGRFDGLRLAGEFGDSQPFEEIVRQRPVERHRMPGAIGIGGRLTTPPLPHHQDIRVSIRRFGGLCMSLRRDGSQAE